MPELGAATFASSVRSNRVGAAAALAPDGLPRLVVNVSLTVTQTTKSGAVESKDAAAPVELLGPGDVLGIAPAEVLRVFPNVGEHAAEPNYLASIEFDSPELPWLVSLGTGDQARPWIALVVLSDSSARVSEQAGSLLPWLVADTAELPPTAELWAWAHAHAQGDASLGTPAPSDGRRTLSRLLCPTQMQPSTAYVAAVVPTYQAGVLAAMRQNPDNAGDQPSWAQDQGTVQLPMYYHWRFQTGASGDFEELARQLKAIDASDVDGLGRIDLRLAQGGLDELAPRDLDPVHTLLVSPEEDATGDAEVPQVEGQVATVLQTAVDEAQGDDDRVVRPPRYGQWPAGDTAVRGGPDWYAELNLVPHHRVIARLGADVVRTQQEELVAEARRQLGEYRAARRIRDLLRLGEMTATRLHERSVAAVPDERLVTMARPVLHTLVSGADAQLSEMTAVNGFGTSLLASSFARIAERVSSRTGVPAALMRADFVAGSMKGDLVAFPVAETRPKIDLGRVTAVFERAGLLDQTVEGVRIDQFLALVPAAQEAQDQLVTAFRNDRIEVHPVQVQPDPAEPQDQAPDDQPPEEGGGPIALPFRQGEGRIQIEVDLNEVAEVTLQPAVVLQHLSPGLREVLAAQPQLLALDVNTVRALRIPLQLPTEIADQRIDSAVQDRVGLAIAEAITPLTQGAVEQGLPEAAALRFTDLVVDQYTIDLAATFDQGAGGVVMQLDARDAVRRNLGFQVFGPVLRDQLTEEGQHQFDEVVATLATRQVSDELRYPAAPTRVTVDRVAAPCRAGLRAETTYTTAVGLCLPFAIGRVPSLVPMGFVPRFDAPLADRLQRAQNKWVLAGADRVPPNSITVVMTNPAFVEAFTAGANHEMARELLWRDVPSDARGTVFSRFWNTPLDDADKLLTPLHQWRKPLGKNLGTGSPYLCVLVRSPLMRRYPNAVIQAAQGQLLPQEGGRNFEPDPATFRTLMFQGGISPDISFSVIDLTEKEVRTAPADKPWFLLLGEPVTEPKFGLDTTASPKKRLLSTWRDAAWTDVTSGAVLSVGDENLTRQHALDGVAWGTDSAALARILHQDPFRLVLPAAKFLGMEG